MTDAVELDLRLHFPSLRDELPEATLCFAVPTEGRDPLERDDAMHILGADLDRVATWRSRDRRSHYFAGRTAAWMLAQAAGLSQSVHTDTLGAPYLESVNGRQPITITHSGAWAMAAMAGNHVFGMDYEVGLPGRAHLRRRVCGDGEIASHDLRDPETETRAYALGCIWTMKEALFKAYGVGLVAELKDVEVGPVAPDGTVCVRALQPLHPTIPHPLPRGLYCAVRPFEGHPLAVVGCAPGHSA